MILVDYAGDCFHGLMGHSPWDNVRLADFVMPFFLFIVGVSLVLSFKASSKPGKSWAMLLDASKRSLRLWLLGFLVQGVHWGNCDLSAVRYCGILQRIAWGFFVVTFAEVLLPLREEVRGSLFMG